MSKLHEKPQFQTTNQAYEDYALGHSSPELPLLARLERATHFVSTTPGMLSGNLQGLLLQMISHMIRPASVLEIGTFTAYATICLAQGLRDNGMVHSIDNNPEIRHIADTYIEEAGLRDKVSLHLGNALDLLPGLDGPFDLVFIDADKENYASYYEAVMPKLVKGGFLIADNVLWYGKVIGPDAGNDKETRGIVRFNELICSDERIEHLLLPIRDGLMLVRKK